MLDALFLWIRFFFESLSTIAVTSFKRVSACDLSVVSLNLLMKVRVVLNWYLFLSLFVSLDLTLFNADLWFAIFVFDFFLNSKRKDRVLLLFWQYL